jgi:peptide chain release factor subunit 1
VTNAIVHPRQAQQLLAARGPFASIYFNDTQDAPDGAGQLDVLWRDIRRELEEQGAQAMLIASLESAVSAARPSVGRSGHGVVAGADGVVINE